VSNARSDLKSWSYRRARTKIGFVDESLWVCVEFWVLFSFSPSLFSFCSEVDVSLRGEVGGDVSDSSSLRGVSNVSEVVENFCWTFSISDFKRCVCCWIQRWYSVSFWYKIQKELLSSQQTIK
jgi:hypothetical protein